MTICDVAIVGAGPYGLSTAAHLRTANGRVVLVFGEPMSFWQKHMPKGMFLRSPVVASNSSDAASSLELGSFWSPKNSAIPDPLPLDQFIEYGRWFQKKAFPDVDTRNVTRVESNTDGFQLTLADGEKLRSRRVVVAAGIVPFAHRLSQFTDFPSDLVSHSCDHRYMDRFADMHVAVLGGGQSALES